MRKVNPPISSSVSPDSPIAPQSPAIANLKAGGKKVPKKGGAFTPKRLNTSIKFDGIHPADYLKFDLRLSCEDCTHFNHEAESCTLGYVTQWHRKAFQEHSYELTGKVALCRFQEID